MAKIQMYQFGANKLCWIHLALQKKYRTKD